MNSSESVTCVTVTYGERRHLLTPVLERLQGLSPSLGAVVVVFNGVPYDPLAFLHKLGLGVPIIPVVSDVNEGSAGGFSRGLMAAFEDTRSEFLWLLDDDNCPQVGALRALAEAHQLLGGSPEVVLSSLRTGNWEQLEAVYQGRPMRVRTNSFLGFHVGSVVANRLCKHRLTAASAADHPGFPLVRAHCAPYGGLFIHRRWWTTVGGPRRDFLTYGDDYEYTMRVERAGGRLYICASSRVDDLERTWKTPSDCHSLMEPQGDEQRVYLGVRNHVALERAYTVTSRIVYFVNALLFLARMTVGSWRCWLRAPGASLKRARVLRDALGAGWNARAWNGPERQGQEGDAG